MVPYVILVIMEYALYVTWDILYVPVYDPPPRDERAESSRRFADEPELFWTSRFRKFITFVLAGAEVRAARDGRGRDERSCSLKWTGKNAEEKAADGSFKC